jgi:prephenate dehydrogenase
MSMPIRQITIVGTGLIGGSLGLALRANGFVGAIVGCDKPAVLETAQQRSAIDRGEADLERAIEGNDVIVLATPVGCILSQLEAIAPLVSADTLITDVGSTKQPFAARARLLYGADAHTRVLPGHPMAGKEHGGIDHADAGLFRDAAWIVTPIEPDAPYTARQQEWLALLASLGARPVTLDVERHDRLCAWVSHLPQMISTAFATVLRDELGDDDMVVQIGGRALREMTRIAHSPYSMWRDIALTNSQNIEEVLLRFEQQLTYLRENLRGPALRELFESANKFGQE